MSVIIPSSQLAIDLNINRENEVILPEDIQSLAIDCISKITQRATTYIAGDNDEIGKRSHLMGVRANITSNVDFDLPDIQQILIQSLIETVQIAIPGLDRHQERVASWAKIIAIEMGLSSKEIENIEIASRIHDVGKLCVGPEIISKDGELTGDEYRSIQDHPVHAANAIRGIVNDDILRGIRGHHESFDGNGYPDGLEGENISIEARVIKVSDSLDAMRRTYNRGRKTNGPLTITEIKREVDRLSGQEYDPQVVQAFRKVYL